MNLFHGTIKIESDRMVKPNPPHNIDVTVGGGELGRGFYLGNSCSLAASWARGKGMPQPVLITVEAIVNDYIKLYIVTFNHQKVVNLSNQLKYSGREYTYIYGADVIYGPFATYPNAEQYKFESKKAQNVLNKWKMGVTQI